MQEMRHLNRIIVWDRLGITWEPDPRHVELLCCDVGVTGTSITTPLAKEKVESLDVPEVPSDDDASWRFRSRTCREKSVSWPRACVPRRSVIQ